MLHGVKYERDKAHLDHLILAHVRHTKFLQHVRHVRQRMHPSLLFLAFSLLLLVLSACDGGSATSNTTNALASKQVLTFPNVGTTDIATFDPAQGPDANSVVAIGMVLSGLVRSDKNLNVIPDQATFNFSWYS